MTEVRASESSESPLNGPTDILRGDKEEELVAVPARGRSDGPDPKAGPTPSISEQKNFWDAHWQKPNERKVLNEWTERRATEILGLIRGLNLQRPRLLDMGCGLGWFTERLAELGEAHGIDLSFEGIAVAKARRPDLSYLSGNVYEAPLPKNYFDIVVSQEVIAHVENQPKYVERAAEVLKPGGYLIITTGNKFIMDRLGDVGWHVFPPEHIETELYRGQLKRMLGKHFEVLKDFTVIPQGHGGILRLLNSHSLNSFLAKFVSEEKLTKLKEKAGFGWQMIFLARKKA
jgi:SAM-dependent methyltransferase